MPSRPRGSNWKSALGATGVALATLLFANTSLAVGVGDITVKSALNQPLEAEIELLSVGSRERDQIVVTVAGRDVFDRMGIDRSPFVDQLQFKVLEKSDGRTVVAVTTPAELQEPFLNFLIEVNWPTGRLLREFTVLLDPPKLTEDKAQTPQAPEIRTPPELAALPPPAPLPPPVVSAPPPPPPPVVEEPKATEEPPPPVAEIEPVNADSNLQYGPVKNGDALWNIADQMRPKNIRISQMMLALLRDNPDAFMGNNINRLKAGQVLRIKDDAQLSSIGVEEAVAEVQRQYQEWLTFRQGRLARHQASQLAANTDNNSARGEDSPVPAKKASEGDARKSSKATRLELVTPKANKPSAEQAESQRAAAREMTKNLNKLHAELNEAASNLDRIRKDNQTKKSQVSALEKQISDMQLMIALKDQELHLLQQRMREHGIDPEEGAFKGREESPLGQLDMSVGDKRAPALDRPKATADNKDKENKDTKAAKDAEKDKKDAKAKGPGFWSTPWFWLGVGAALAIGGAAFWWRSRRAQQEDLLDLDEPPPEDGIIGTVTTKRTSPIVIDDSPGDTAASRGEVIAKQDNDPLSEAEVYLTYGRYQKAKEVLKSAIIADPDRQELKLKLLETYYFAEDRAGFEKQAEELYAALGGQPGPLWNKAMEMGQDLVPDNPLFRPMGALGETFAPSAASRSAGKSLDETLVIDSAKVGSDKPKRSSGEPARPPAWAMERSEPVPSKAEKPMLDETVVSSKSQSASASSRTSSRSAREVMAAEDEPSPPFDRSVASTPVIVESESIVDEPQEPPSPEAAAAPMTEDDLLREEAEVRAMLEEAVSSYITAMEQNQAEAMDEPMEGQPETVEPVSRSHYASHATTPLDADMSSGALRAAVDDLDQALHIEPSHHTGFAHESTVEGTLEPDISNDMGEDGPRSAPGEQSRFSHSRFAALQDAAEGLLPEGISAEPLEVVPEQSPGFDAGHNEVEGAFEENPLPVVEETATIGREAMSAGHRAEEPPMVEARSAYTREPQANATSTAELGLEDDLDEDTFFLFNDEVGTKLDLARAYIEMGDTEGAREILDEVMGEGNDKHKAEAQDLIRLVDKVVTGQT